MKSEPSLIVNIHYTKIISIKEPVEILLNKNFNKSRKFPCIFIKGGNSQKLNKDNLIYFKYTSFWPNGYLFHGSCYSQRKTSKKQKTLEWVHWLNLPRWTLWDSRRSFFFFCESLISQLQCPRYDGIISWSDDGTVVLIRDSSFIKEEVLPYFETCYTLNTFLSKVN